MRKYTIVTVVFEGDVELMYLQARSVSLYSDPSLLEEIIVIDNFTKSKPRRWEEKLLASYGYLAPKVKIVEASSVTNVLNATGWFTQQALKLAVSKLVRTDRYVVLDSKNHLIKPLTRDFLENSDGKARINGYGYDKHPLRSYLEKTCAFVGVSVTKPLQRFVRTSTPFTMITSSALALVESAEAKNGKDLIEIITENGLTEFFWYAAVLEAAGVLEEIYDFTQPFSPDIWKWGAEDLTIIQEAVDKATADHTGPFFTVHRGAIPLFTPAARNIICAMWTARGLFTNHDEAFEFLSNI